MLLSMRLLTQLVALAGVASAAKLTQTVDGERRNVLFTSRRLDQGYCQPECSAPTPSPVANPTPGPTPGPVAELITPAPVTPRPTLAPTPSPVNITPSPVTPTEPIICSESQCPPGNGGDLYCPVTSGAITGDGDISDWQSITGSETGIPMYTAGDDTKTHISNAFLTYDCGKLCVLVESVDPVAYPISTSQSDSWLKIYNLGSNALTTVDGTVNVHHFTDSNGNVAGWEACYDISPGCYNQVQIHANYDGHETTSTGKVDEYFGLDLPACPSNSNCPFFLLDFAELVPGTYIHDELAYSHGVTITAIRKGTSWGHTPINGVHVNSGGGAMVFDSRHPTGNDGQGLCVDTDGDPDLGSPNSACPGGGPGHGPGGEPTRVVNGVTEQNPYANCESQGKILIIQEEDKSCPDDTRDGGFLVFEFETPTEVDFAKLLDVDEGNTPDFHITYGDGSQQTLSDTPGTGDNGVLSEPLQKTNVKKVSIEYHGSGSISELSYRFCPPQATTPTYVKKLIDFEDGTLGGFTRSGSTAASAQCAVIDDSRCSGAKSVSCPATNSEVSMQIEAPAGAYLMTYKFSIPNNMESADKIHVIVGGVTIKEYENDADILSSGLECFEASVFVNPGDEVKFLIYTTASSEYFYLHEVEFLINTAVTQETRYDFEDDTNIPFATSGTGNNGWRIEPGQGCVGNKGVKAGTQTGSEVMMTTTVPAGMNKMSFVHTIPSAVFEDNDKLWVNVGGSNVREFEEDAGIRTSGVNCRVEVINVAPGQDVTFTAQTSYTDEYWAIDEIVFYQG